MATVDGSHVDLEKGGCGGCHSSPVSSGGSDRSSTSSDGHDPSWHSHLDSAAAAGSAYDGRRSSSVSGSEIVGVSNKRRGCSASECSVEVDLESGVPNIKEHFAKSERDCRICHLSFDASNHESGIPIELGCSCKDDLAAAHKQCAEAWFKIKGNKTCEICGSTARNVAGLNESELMEQWNETNDAATTAGAASGNSAAETRNFWQGHRFLNFLLACMVFFLASLLPTLGCKKSYHYLHVVYISIRASTDLYFMLYYCCVLFPLQDLKCFHVLL